MARKTVKEHGLIDWTRGAEQVRCQVRAMQPWPTAYSFWRREGKPALRLIVHTARALPDAVAEPPGRVLPSPSSLLVATGSGVVEVLELTPQGKGRMTGAEFVRGRRPQAGDRMGSEE
ncbi:MAG: hypothetical protein K2W96_03295 [Gemmataceae bacterium]|nr:hypothetical protein [Gemmataceae bacterium]